MELYQQTLEVQIREDCPDHPAGSKVCGGDTQRRALWGAALSFAAKRCGRFPAARPSFPCQET
jgi:hypothetical protein